MVGPREQHIQKEGVSLFFSQHGGRRKGEFISEEHAVTWCNDMQEERELEDGYDI